MLTQTQKTKAFGMENKLDNVLKTAAASAPIISSKQVLQYVATTPNKNSLAKYTMLFGAFGVIILVLFFTCKSYFSTTRLNTVNNVNVKHKPPVLQTKPIAKIPIETSAETNSTTTLKTPLQYDTQTTDNNASNNIDLPLRLTSGMPLQSNTRQQEMPNETNENYQTEELTLNFAELADLGIITDGNTLTYFAITDTFRKIKDSEFDIKYGAESYNLYIEKHGSSRTDKGNCFDTIEAKKSKPFYAAAVELDNGLNTHINTVNNLYGDGYEDKYIDSVKPHLIPIDVELKAVKEPLSHDVNVRFWFKNTNEFLAALPAYISSHLKISYPDIKDETYFNDVVKYYRSFDRQLGIYDYTPEFITSLQQRYSVISAQGIKQLGIKIKPNMVKLKLVAVDYSEKHGKNSVSKMRYLNKGQSTFINLRKKRVITTKHAYKKMELAPIACSDAKITSVGFLRNYKNNGYVFSIKTNYQGFKKIAPDLIPILVDSQHVFWYEPNATINNIIKQYKK